MYSLFSRILNFVAESTVIGIDIVERKESEGPKKGTGPPSYAKLEIEDKTSDSKNSLSNGVRESGHELLKDLNQTAKLESGETTKCIFGEVTSLFSGRGLIDDQIYFSKDSIIGFEKLQMGDKVSVDAYRTNTQGGWMAKRVTMVNEWNTDLSETTGSVSEILGLVTYYMKGSGLVNEKHSFTRATCVEGYIPIVNDFVHCELKIHQGMEEEVLSVKPIRENKFIGIITDTINRYGFIDHDVYYHISVCNDHYHPRKGDHVSVIAIESKQRKSNWRAIKVEKLQQDTNSVQVDRNREFKGKYVEMLLMPKNGVFLTKLIDFGNVASGDAAMEIIFIRNNGTQEQVLKEAKLFRSNKQFGFIYSQESCNAVENLNNKSWTDFKFLRPGSIILPGEEKCIILQLKSEFLGKFENIAVLNFGSFKIGCRLSGNVYDPIQSGIGPRSAFSFRPVKNTANNEERIDCYQILPGQRPLRKKKAFLPKHLKQHEIPKTIKNCILNGEPIEQLVPDIMFPLTMKNHRLKLATLLYAEEINLEEEMRQFDMQMVTLRSFAEFLILSVPGLAEGRPSLLMGDKVVLEIHGSAAQSPRYEGCIHEVRAEEILLKFNESFHKMYRNEDCNVQFFFNRTPIRRNHQAVEHAANLGEAVLFPTTVKSKYPLAQTYDFRTRKEINLFNKNLNERQKCAVSRILAAQSRPTPYLLFGPPGTGKTVTLVEAILQVYTNISNSRILACAPSNSASDLIAQRLLESSRFSKGELIRLNAFQRGQDIHEALEPYCTSDTDDLMLSCHYRIIVCTCSMSGILYSAGLESGHFTHVFVDEAGQSTEPECLIPIGMIAGNEDGQVVLAGDPYQLGPILSSTIASDYGMTVSLLERLISRSTYGRDESKFAEYGCYDPLLVTKLVENYRSHAMLLNLSSTVFYHSELQPCAPPAITSTFSNSSILPTKNFPIIFHGIRGEDMREGNSPSWFNPTEAVQVLKYVQLVMSLSGDKITLDDIGIIVPYRKQVEKIRLLLERVNMEDIKVGSVEEFQGQERQVVIISTVRSNESFVSFDNRHALGFLSNPKRFNVAVTRAQALLIVVGNPHILTLDPYWCSLIQYCVAHSAFIGCDLPSLDSPMVKKNFLKALQLLGVSANETEVSETEVSEENSIKDD